MANLEKCEGCDQYKKVALFGKDDVELCVGEAPGEKGCWDSAYHHEMKKFGECGVDSCRICYEPEE